VDAMFVVMHLLNAHRVVLCHFAQVLAAEFGVEHETSQKLRTTDTPSSLSHLTIILPRDEGLPVAQHLECCNKLYLRCTGHPSTAVNSLGPKVVIGRQALDDMFCLGSGYAKKAFELIVVEPGSGAEVVVVYAFTCSLAIVFHALPLGWPLIVSIAPPLRSFLVMRCISCCTIVSTTLPVPRIISATLSSSSSDIATMMDSASAKPSPMMGLELTLPMMDYSIVRSW